MDVAPRPIGNNIDQTAIRDDQSPQLVPHEGIFSNLVIELD
jgi:hypothetical protein